MRYIKLQHSNKDLNSQMLLYIIRILQSSNYTKNNVAIQSLSRTHIVPLNIDSPKKHMFLHLLARWSLSIISTINFNDVQINLKNTTEED